MPNSAPAALLALARAAAAQHTLDPVLVCAIVEQESAWDPHAIRYEPAFRQRYVAPLGLPPTEEVARSISWGLMQVMGQVAREHGFRAKSLAALCDPATALDVGCAVFAAKLHAAGTDAAPIGAAAHDAHAASVVNHDVDAAGIVNQNLTRALALWNGGANPDYAAQVFARLANY